MPTETAIAQRRRELIREYEPERRAQKMIIDQQIDAMIEDDLQRWIEDQEEFEDKPLCVRII